MTIQHPNQLLNDFGKGLGALPELEKLNLRNVARRSNFEPIYEPSPSFYVD